MMGAQTLRKYHYFAPFLFFVFLHLSGAEESAAVGRKGPDLYNHDSPFSLWGLDISAAALSDDSTDQAMGALDVYAKYGISSVVLSFQPPGKARGAFAADGSIADASLSKRILTLSGGAIDRWMVPVVRIFSFDPSAGMESPAAYDRALTEVARLFAGTGDLILNIGNVSSVEELPKYVRVLRERGYRGLIGAELDQDIPAPVDVVFRKGDPEGPVPSVAPDKPVVITAILENPDSPGEPSPSIDEFLSTIARKRGFYLVARIPSCCEGDSARFDIGGQDARSGMGVAWYLSKVSDTQSSLHGPIDESVATISSEIPLLDRGEKEEGFVPLFDGQTLRGWTMLSDSWQSFSAQDGVIACNATSPNSYLRTSRRYSDFILRLDVKIEPGGNSGIFIRAPLWGRSSRIGFEVQIDGKPSPRPTVESAGAIYDVMAPKVDAMRPAGEWNSFEITCRGPHVRILINSQTIQDFSMDDVPKLKNRLREGVIGLQDHSDKVWFRKIRIKELK